MYTKALKFYYSVGVCISDGGPDFGMRKYVISSSLAICL